MHFSKITLISVENLTVLGPCVGTSPESSIVLTRQCLLFSALLYCNENLLFISFRNRNGNASSDILDGVNLLYIFIVAFLSWKITVYNENTVYYSSNILDTKNERGDFFFFTCDQIGQTTAGPGTPVSLNLNNNRIRKPATSENYFLN